MNEYCNIEIQKLASSAASGRYLLGYNGKFFEANSYVVELINYLQENADEDVAISKYIEKRQGKYTKKQVKGFIEKYLYPLVNTDVPQKRKQFLYEKELFSASLVDKITPYLVGLFNKWLVCGILIFAVIVDVSYLSQTSNLLDFNKHIDAYSIIGIVMFMLGSSLFHELGHATACRHFGIQHKGIGFGLYLNFPVFYTDVTEIWKLNRQQRNVVNLAGVYFQSYCLIGLIIIYMITPSDLIRYLILSMNFGFLMVLTPFFKFDGYWIASDILGVPNLRRRAQELYGYIYHRLRGTMGRKPYLLELKPCAKYTFMVYSILVNLFMGYYFVYIIPSFVYHFVMWFPSEIEKIVILLSNNMAPPFSLLRNICMQLLFLILILVMIYRIVSPLFSKCKK